MKHSIEVVVPVPNLSDDEVDYNTLVVMMMTHQIHLERTSTKNLFHVAIKSHDRMLRLGIDGGETINMIDIKVIHNLQLLKEPR